MRTDIHRPGANIDPADYHYVTSLDLNLDPCTAQGLENEARYREVMASLEKAGIAHSGVYDTNRCDHCGQHIRYASVMIHRPTGGYIWLGGDCTTTFGEKTAADLRRLRAAAVQAQKEQRIFKAFQAACEQQQTLAYATYARNIQAAHPQVNFSFVLSTMDDIASKCRYYGSTATVKQLELLDKLMVRTEETLTKLAAQESARAAERASAEPVPTGRVVITGEVVKVDWKDNDFGGCLVFVVKDDRGFRIWSSVPKDLLKDDQGFVTVDSDPVPGDRVTFTATVEPAERDEYFGFAKRPSKASYLSRVTS